MVQVHDFPIMPKSGEIIYEVNVRYTKADNNKIQRLYSRILNVYLLNNEVIKVEEGMLRVLNNVKYIGESTHVYS